MADDSQEVADIIDALEDPTPLAVYEATSEYDGDYVAAAAASIAANASGGGGSTPDLFGPYHVDFSDIPNDQDDLVLFTPSAGQVVLVCSINPRTITPPESPSSAAMLVGQASELPSSGGGFEGAYWAGMDTDIVKDSGNGGASTDGTNYPGDLAPGYQMRVAPIFPLAEPVVCRNNSGADLTAGAMDVYFLVKTATAP